MAKIYLSTKEQSYVCHVASNVNVSIKVSRNKFDECQNFDVVTYHIKYDGSYDNSYVRSTLNITNYYKLFIYTGSEKKSKRYIYGYRPYNNDNVVKQISSYYYISNSDFPFALVFTTRNNKKIYYTYENLITEGWSSTLLGTVIGQAKLCAQLLSDYKKKYKTFQFTSGSGTNKNVDTKSDIIGSDTKLKKVTFVARPGARKGDQFLLHIDNLFTEVAKSYTENKIDPSSLKSVDNTFLNAVIVYYSYLSDNSKEIAVLIEFIKECQKTHIKRTNNNPPLWIEEKVKYDNDEELIKELDVIKKESESVIIYKLEKNSNDNSYNAGRIKVSNEPIVSESSIIIHSHKPTTKYQKRTSLPQYNGTAIKLVKNSSIGDQYNLTLENQTFTEISTYSLSTSKDEHLLIRLSNSSGTNYMYRYTMDGSSWRQLSLEELKLSGIQVTEGSQSLSEKLDTLLKDSEHKNVKVLLGYISLSINSIFVLVDKMSHYNHSHISPLVKDQITSIGLESYRVFVNDISGKKQCVTSHNYKVYKHHIHEPVQEAKKKAKDSNLYFRLYLLKKRLSLCIVSKESSALTYLKYIDSENHIHVYFYGEDPRPLLFCYGLNAYRPLSFNDYDIKWVKEEKTFKCECESHGIDKGLLSPLSEVVGFLNPVQLEKKTSDLTESGRNNQIETTEFYIIHNYNDKAFKVKVTHQKIDNYEVYKHEPCENGYRLGVIKYEDSMPSETGLSYDLERQLKSVAAYFNTRKYQYPFLVELEFKGNGVSGSPVKEYYKLGSNDKKKWTKMEETSGTDKEFLDRLNTLEPREPEAKPSLVRENPGTEQQSRGDSGTPSPASKNLPVLTSQTSPEISSSKAVPENLPKGGSSESRATEAGLEVDRSSQIGSPQAATPGKGDFGTTPGSSRESETQQPAVGTGGTLNISTHGTSSSSTVLEDTRSQHPQGALGQPRTNEPRSPEGSHSDIAPSESDSSQDGRSKILDSEKETSERDPQQPGTQGPKQQETLHSGNTEDLKQEIRGKEREEQSEETSGKTVLRNENTEETFQKTQDREGSKVLSKENLEIIDKMVSKETSLNGNDIKSPSNAGGSSDADANIPVIAGGTSGGLGLTGSVVGYFAYAKYCKAKAPIQK